MNWFAQIWLHVFLDAAVKSLGLAATAAVAIWALRTRNCNVQHGIWSFVLGGMLVLPILTLASPTIPLPAWMTWQPFFAQDAHRTAHARHSPNGTPIPVDSAQRLSRPLTANDGGLHTIPKAAASPRTTDVKALGDQTADNRLNSSLDERDNSAPLSFLESFLSRTLRSISWVTFAVVLHGTIMLLLLSRLALALHLTHRLVRRARPMSHDAPLPFTGCRVCESSEVRVPVVVSIGHATVLLPDTWRSWNASQLSAVAAHELEHIRRRDPLVTLLAELNRAIHWYHPLAWFLRRNLVQLAECACDDAVIATTSDRFAYARHLVEFASSLRTDSRAHPATRILSNGAAMARSSMVEARVAAILNLQRPLSIRLSGRRGFLLAAIAIPLVLCAAALQPPTSDGDTAQSPPLASIADTSQTLLTADQEENRVKGRTYAGRVLLPNGTPAVNATIYLVDWIATPLKQAPVAPVAITNDDGEFEFATSDFEQSMSSMIVAQLKGHGFAWSYASALASLHELKMTISTPTIQELMQRDRGPMRLKPDNHPVRGRIVDSEGTGIAGVAVRVVEVRGTVDGTMTAWNRVIESPHPDLLAVQSAFSRALLGPQVPSLFEPIETDATGRFTVHGIGSNRIARLTLQGGGIVAESVYVRTSEGNLMTLPPQVEYAEMTMARKFYGSDFTLVADKTVPVVGRVTDEQGQALSGVVITSSEFMFRDMQGEQLRNIRTGSDEVIAVTDDDGQYRLEGLPVADGNPIYLSGPTNSDLIPSQHSVDTSKARQAVRPDRIIQISKDFTLRRGRIVEGRVVSATTGDGVAGILRVFQPGADPNRLQLADGLEWRSSAELQSNREGAFRLVIPRLANVLTFTSLENWKYKLAPLKSPEVTDQPNAVEVNSGAVGLWAVQSTPFHAIHPINADDNGPLRVDMTVVPASVTAGFAIAPTGERPNNIFISSSPREYSRWDYRTDGRIELYGLDAASIRRVSVIDLTNRLAGTKIVQANEEGFAIELQPWAIVRGRIVDENGEPLPVVTIFSAPLPGDQPDGAQSYAPPLPPTESTRSGRFLTDDQGRYEIAGLVPGNSYQLAFSSNSTDFRQRRSGSFITTITLNPGESRDLGDFVLKKSP